MMKRWEEPEDSTPEDEPRHLLPEGAKNLSDAFPPDSISVPDPVSVRDLAAALRMKPHFVIAGLMRLERYAFPSLQTEVDFPTVFALCADYGVVAHKII
jgi:hypothetical protein